MTCNSYSIQELLTSNVAVPAGENFGVFHDQNLQPAVFALSEDGILNLIITVDREPSKCRILATTYYRIGYAQLSYCCIQRKEI